MAWTEVGLEDQDYPQIAKKLKENYPDWNTINEIAIKDVCGSFSIASLSALLLVIPILGMFLVAPMPDWGYDEDYLRKRIRLWEAKPRLVHFLNPLRVLGYPVALLFSWGVRKKLKNAYVATN